MLIVVAMEILYGIIFVSFSHVLGKLKDFIVQQNILSLSSRSVEDDIERRSKTVAIALAEVLDGIQSLRILRDSKFKRGGILALDNWVDEDTRDDDDNQDGEAAEEFLRPERIGELVDLLLHLGLLWLHATGDAAGLDTAVAALLAEVHILGRLLFALLAAAVVEIVLLVQEELREEREHSSGVGQRDEHDDDNRQSRADTDGNDDVDWADALEGEGQCKAETGHEHDVAGRAEHVAHDGSRVLTLAQIYSHLGEEEERVVEGQRDDSRRLDGLGKARNVDAVCQEV